VGPDSRVFIILIRCEMGRTYDVASRIAELENGPTVYSISGDYDVFCMVRLPSNDDLGRFVSEKIQSIDGVKATNTIVCFNAFLRDKGFA